MTLSNNTKSKNQIGAVLPNGKVNVALLQREIANDLSEDALHHAQDEMKKRAVHVSKDYQEFKNFVATSQLQPVSTSDMSELFLPHGMPSKQRTMHNKAYSNKEWDSPFVTSSIGAQNKNDKAIGKGGKKKLSSKDENCGTSTYWNYQTSSSLTSSKKFGRKSKRGNSDGKNTTSSGRLLPTPMEFEREWNNYCTSSPKTVLHYLLQPEISSSPSNTAQNPTTISSSNQLRIQPKDIPRIFHIEMDSTMMGNIIEALHLLQSLSNNSTCTPTSSDTSNQNHVRLSISPLNSTNPSHSEPHLPQPIFTMTRSFQYEWIYQWLIALTQCGRFALNVDFLSQVQQSQVGELVTSLEEYLNDASLVCDLDNVTLTSDCSNTTSATTAKTTNVDRINNHPGGSVSSDPNSGSTIKGMTAPPQDNSNAYSMQNLLDLRLMFGVN